MSKRMCGDCSKKQGSSLEDRIIMSMIGELGEPYHCSICLKIKKVPDIRDLRQNKKHVSAIIAIPVIKAPAKVKPEKKKIIAEVEQLQFFTVYDSIEFRN